MVKATAKIEITLTRECRTQAEADQTIKHMMDEAHLDYLADGMKFRKDGERMIYNQNLPSEGIMEVVMTSSTEEE